MIIFWFLLFLCFSNTSAPIGVNTIFILEVITHIGSYFHTRPQRYMLYGKGGKTTTHKLKTR